MQLEDFLKASDYFSLGHLPTEGFHPATEALSTLAKTDLESAIEIVRQVFPMFPLTLEGLGEAVTHLVRGKGARRAA